VLEPAIAEYRYLARTLANRKDMAIAGLADALREACRVGGRARGLVAALLWTMGLVAECNAARRSAEPCGRALLLRLIRSSLQILPTDPLVQYLWLEMKDAPELDLRAHGGLYAVLNHRWAQWRADETYELFGLPAEPSRLYGRALEALLAGNLDEARASDFLKAYDLVSDLRLSGPPAAFIMPRLDLLRYLIGEQLDYFGPEFTDHQRVEWLREAVIDAARKRAAISMFPGWPDASTRTGIALHETIERLLGEDSKLPTPERERSAIALESLELFRTGALSYWLDVIPPLSPANPGEQLGQLLAEERVLLDRMRGAYFLALRPTLPLHYLWSDMDMSDMFALDTPGRRASFYSADVGREEMSKLDVLVASVANLLSKEASKYAEARQRPSANLARLVSMLGDHRAQ